MNKYFKSILLFWLTLDLNGNAQEVVTNFVKAAANFREVNGKLYNTELSQLFQYLCIEPDIISTNGLVAWHLKPIKHSWKSAPASDLQSVGAYTGAGSPAGSSIVGFERDYRIFIRNWPANADEIQIRAMSKAEAVARHEKRTDADFNISKLQGNQICVRALKVGMFDFNGKIMEAWDVGTPHVVAVITTNSPSQK